MTDILARISGRAKGHSPLLDLHPELVNRIPIMRVFSDMITSQAQPYYDVAVSDYGNYAWVHKAIKVLADNIASLRVEVVKGEGDEKESLPNHELSQVLQQPNPTMASADLWRQWIIDMMLGGEEGHEIVRNNGGSRVLEIWPRQPSIFDIQPGEGGRRYANVARYKIDDGQGPEYFLNPDQFIHYKFFNPANPWRGIAPIMAIRMSITIDQFAQAWSRLFFKNQARPDYAVIAPEGLTSSEKREMELRLTEEHQGHENWHRPIVLESGVTDVKALSFPPKDLAWIEQRKLARDEIGAIFGIPDEIMGYGRDTYENFGTAMKVLWTLTLVPLIRFRDVVFTSWAIRHKLLDTGMRVETDLTAIPELQEDKTAKVAQYVQLVGMAIPPNVAIEMSGLGIPPIAGGDVGYLPVSYVPITGIDGGKSAPIGRVMNKAIVPEYGSQEHETLWKRHQLRFAPLKEKMKRMLKKFWQRQQNEVGRRLRESRDFGRGQYKQDDVPPVEQIFDLETEIALFEQEFGPIVYGVIAAVAADEIAALGLDIVFDIDRPEVVAAYRAILTKVSQKTQQRVWLELVDLFEEAEMAGEGIPAIMERLSAFYGDLKSAYQIERIARTTTTPAANAGATEAWRQTEVVSQREWLSALIPGRTRDDHAEAHGQRRDLDEAFEVGDDLLLYPGDPIGHPANIINCLCSLAPVVRGEEAIIPVGKSIDTSLRKEISEEEMKTEVHIHLPENMMSGLEFPAPQITVEPANIIVEAPPPAEVNITVEPPPPAEVKVTLEPSPPVEVKVEPQIDIHLPETEIEIEVLERDRAGRMKKIRKTNKRTE